MRWDASKFTKMSQEHVYFYTNSESSIAYKQLKQDSVSMDQHSTRPGTKTAQKTTVSLNLIVLTVDLLVSKNMIAIYLLRDRHTTESTHSIIK